MEIPRSQEVVVGLQGCRRRTGTVPQLSGEPAIVTNVPSNKNCVQRRRETEIQKCCGIGIVLKLNLRSQLGKTIVQQLSLQVEKVPPIVKRQEYATNVAILPHTHTHTTYMWQFRG